MITDPIVLYLLNNFDEVLEQTKTKLYPTLETYFTKLLSFDYFAAGLTAPVPLPISIIKECKEIHDKKIRDRQLFIKLLNGYCDKKYGSNYQLSRHASVDAATLTRIQGMIKTDYKPKKETLFCICIALELSLEETNMLLLLSGNTLDPNSIPERIVEWYIQESVNFKNDPSFKELDTEKRIDNLDKAIKKETGDYYLTKSIKAKKKLKETLS